MTEIDNLSSIRTKNQDDGSSPFNEPQELPHSTLDQPPHSRHVSRAAPSRLRSPVQRSRASHNPSVRHNNPPRRPHFSLAGSRAPPAHAPSFIDPSYYRLNPEYDQPIDKPVWGLAKPLPRIVRHGRQPSNRASLVHETIREPRQGPTGTEAAPQVARIPTQRAEENVAHHNGRKHSNDVFEHQKNELAKLRERLAMHSTPEDVGEEDISGNGTGPAPGFGATVGGSATSVERYGSPRVEMKDPMDQYGATHSDAQMTKEFAVPESSPKPRRQPPLSGKSTVLFQGDIGATPLRNLSDVEEVESHESWFSRQVSAGTTSREWDRDLEACKEYNDGLGLDDEKAGHQDGNDFDEAFEYGEENGYHNWWAPIRERYREPLAEGLATFVFALIALSANLSAATSNLTAGDYQSTNWAGGLGIMIGIYIAGGISGGHLNPAISIILCVYRGFPPRKTLVYMAAQCFGAFLAALVAFGIYKNAILELDDGMLNAGLKNSGHAFITGLQSWTSPAEGWGNEFVATGILACAILALGDDMNAPPGAGMHAFIVGLVVTVLGMAFGSPTGACLNPARDFGPRLAAWAVGYGHEIFRTDYAWWIWGAWLSTISGALTGAFLYDAFIFMGGESPVNYLGRKEKSQRRSRKEWFGRWWREGSERSKTGGTRE